MKTSFLLITCIFGYVIPSFSQVITFPYKENFEWQVKQIDEFIDRFNNADYTPLRLYLQEQYDMKEVDRIDLIKSLFNFENGNWNKKDVLNFLNDVTKSNEPPYLDFYDTDWYAELECSGIYRGKKENFVLVLSIEKNERTGSAKWIINSVNADFLPAVDSVVLAYSLNNQQHVSQSINPGSFGTDFMALIDALNDTASFSNYLNRDQISMPLLSFFDQLYQRNLIFKQVNHITYHFLQVPNWLFQVEDFTRQSVNSGWLISNLVFATDEEKKEYRANTLHLNY